MKWTKIGRVRRFALLGLSVATLGFLAACGNGGNETANAGNETANGTTSEETPSTPETAERAPISIMAPFLSEMAPEENSLIQQEIERLTGFELDITWIANSGYGDRLSLVMAGDDVPDVLVVPGNPINDASIVSAAEHGGFWNLSDHIDNFNYLAMMNPGVRMNASFNGEDFGIYRARDLIRASINIRRDWLEEVGMDTPTTIEEFTDMLFAFRDAGLGYGITIPQWGDKNTHGPFDIISVMFGAPNRTAIVDGEVVFDFMTDEYMESLEWMRMLFEEGLINRDFATLPTDDWNNDFVNGNAGVIIDMQSRGMSLANLMRDRYEAEEGSDWVTMIGTVETNAGEFILPTTGFNGLIMIPTMSVQDEARLNEVLTFLNYLNSEEIHTLLNLGIEGVHWQLDENGVLERLVNDDEAQERQDVATIASFAQIGMGVSGFALPANFNEETGTRLELERVEIRDGQRYQDIAVFDPTQPFISETETLRGSLLSNIMADARVQFISGQIDHDGFEAEVQRWLTSGGQQVIDELTEKYQAGQN